MGNIENIVILAILAVIVAGIVWYLIRAKKRGVKCIGCSHAKECRGKCNGTCQQKDKDK